MPNAIVTQSTEPSAKGQRLAFGDDVMNGFWRAQAGPQHGFAGIDRDHERAALRHAARDVAGSGRQIDDRFAGPRRGGRGKGVLPEPVDAEAHQIVHEIVARRDVLEDAADQPTPLGGVHRARAELAG